MISPPVLPPHQGSLLLLFSFSLCSAREAGDEGSDRLVCSGAIPVKEKKIQIQLGASYHQFYCHMNILLSYEYCDIFHPPPSLHRPPANENHLIELIKSVKSVMSVCQILTGILNKNYFTLCIFPFEVPIFRISGRVVPVSSINFHVFKCLRFRNLLRVN